MEKQPYFKLKQIVKTFGVTKALNGVDLDIYAGEVIGFVGPNGAGKSTLMKVLTGILTPTEGEIIIQGKAEEHYSPKRAKQIGVACAYQDLSLCTNLSVYENFAMLNVSHGLISSLVGEKRQRRTPKHYLKNIFREMALMLQRQ